MTESRLERLENTDQNWATNREAPPFTAPAQLCMILFAGIIFIAGLLLIEETAHQVGPVQTYVSAWCLMSLGGHFLAGVIAAENYRRMRSLARGKFRMQQWQLALRERQEKLVDGQAELKKGQADLNAGQKVLEDLIIRLEEQFASGMARIDASHEAIDLAKTEILVVLEEVGDGVQSGVSVVEQAYGVAADALDVFAARRVRVD